MIAPEQDRQATSDHDCPCNTGEARAEIEVILPADGYIEVDACNIWGITIAFRDAGESGVTGHLADKQARELAAALIAAADARREFPAGGAE